MQSQIVVHFICQQDLPLNKITLTTKIPKDARPLGCQSKSGDAHEIYMVVQMARTKFLKFSKIRDRYDEFCSRDLIVSYVALIFGSRGDIIWRNILYDL